MIVATISEKVDKSDVESVTSESIKDEPALSLSRAYSVTSEPPAYKKPTSSSVRIARLIAITVVAVALILGTAIVVAAYLQSRHNSAAPHFVAPASSTETNKAVTAAVPSALTGDAPNGVGEPSSSEASSEATDDEKDHRRLDTDGDLLEEFLENEGKILRLPTGSDLDIDIDELTKMFLKRNPLDKSNCVVERRPIDGSDDFVKVLPITPKNASDVPLMPIVSGERISIICSSDDDITDTEDDSNLIPSRPIILPFGLGRSPMKISPFDLPFDTMSVIGPIPLMMNPGRIMNHGPMMMPKAMRPQLPLNLTPPPVDLTNSFLEQRAFNMPPPHMRSPFQAFPAARPFRMPEPISRQIRPFGPVMPSPFQSFPQRPFGLPILSSEKRINLPTDLEPENSQEKSHVPEHRNIDSVLPITPSTPSFQLNEQHQQFPLLPPIPEGLLGLLEDLPDIIAAEEEEEKSADGPSKRPEHQNVPVFRMPKMMLSPPTGPRIASAEAPSGPVPLPAHPVTLPFLQVPPFPAALAKERSAPTPVNIPFLNVRNVVSTPNSPNAKPEQRQGRPSFFERLMDSILSVGNNNKNNNNSNNRASKDLKVSTDSMPVETRATVEPVRTGGRGLRMPEDGHLTEGLVVARPIDSHDEITAPEQDRRGRSHFIQPRSLKVN